jgi:hypothetical protein
LDTSTWATVASVGRPPSISRVGAGACTTTSSQDRQAGPAYDQHPELGGYNVEAFGDVFADPVQRAGAAGADHACHVDHRLDPRQVRRQRATVRAAFGGAGLALRGALGLGEAGCFDLLGFLECELELLLGQAFGAATKAMTL